ncbi:MAG TPA: hypothetical protein PLO36_06125 [Methanofastidiosum sp.]|nr:hypothetical protein [Methanofastidiosum sp.]HPA49691.1 hypothetical protein [Methanofastidiosum sp.]HQK62607.1 hypothetical protein [Methanofastidiosum sp.]HQQ49381.1 hypothetical protein [Methanofastidiosum sp.]
MKKIFAILISLLFVASVFGVATTMAKEPCKYEFIGPESVQVGDTFQVKLMISGGCCWSYYGGVKDSIESICTQPECEGYDIIPGGYLFTYKALKVGTYEKLLAVGCFEDERVYYGVTVTPREYPMLSFMKLLGLGKFKK